MIPENKVPKCGNCKSYQKVGKRSGMCKRFSIEILNTKTKKTEKRHPSVFKYHYCMSFQQKPNSDTNDERSVATEAK